MKDNLKDLSVIQVVPPYFALPVRNYGGTERVAWNLTTGLAQKGIDVELYAPGDTESVRGVRLSPICNQAFGLDVPYCAIERNMHSTYVDVFKRKQELEAEGKNVVVHFHTDSMQYPFARAFKQVCVSTMHNKPVDWIPDTYPEMPVVSISHAQAKSEAMQKFDFVRVVHNGIEPDIFEPRLEYDDDAPLVFLGRINAEKGTDKAIDIAVQSGHKLIIAGPPSLDEPDFFDRVVKPKMAQYPDLISYVGEVSDISVNGEMSSKAKLLRDAKALLFPIKWAEPFGLVQTEAMACGTPVIAFNYPGSSVDEVIHDGVNGYKVTNVEEAADIIKSGKLAKMSRAGVRENFIQNYSTPKMVEGYLAVYKEVSKMGLTF
jgi:glycosyltransferase involved in cell wall biosynthesis